jgi:hypothetical protein
VSCMAHVPRVGRHWSTTLKKERQRTESFGNWICWRLHEKMWKGAYPEESIRRSQSELLDTLYQSHSYFCDRRSVIQSVSQSISQSVSASQSIFAMSPSGAHDQILAVIKTVEVLFVVGRPLDDRTVLSCNKSRSLSVITIYAHVHSELLTNIFVFKFLLHHLRPAPQVLYTRLCLLFRYCPKI